jgi:hypothetical protein
MLDRRCWRDDSRSGRSGRDLVGPYPGCPHGLRPIGSARLNAWAAHERRGDRVEGASWQGHAGELEWGRAVASSAAERAARAGSGLSAASIHWGRRPAAPKPLAVTERDRRLLALLHDVNYLSSSQMALLGWGVDSTCTRRRLRLLHDRGLIDKFRPAAPAGSYEWNYRLTGEGWRMLSDHGMSADRKLYKPAEIHSIAYVEHDLQVNALVLHIAHRARAGEGPLLDAMPFAWRGPRRGEIDPREEQAPEGESQLRSRLPALLSWRLARRRHKARCDADPRRSRAAPGGAP